MFVCGRRPKTKELLDLLLFLVSFDNLTIFQELQNDLCQKLSGLAKARDEKLIRDAFDLLKMASKDNKVWKGGLDTAYNRFKAIYDSNNKVANVILSIL